MSSRDAYEVIPYEDRPVAQTHPDRLYVAARAVGLAAVEPTAAAILELGCAHAVNLMPIAAMLPRAQLVGVDRSAVQIALAQRRAQTCGLANLELQCADVMTLDLGARRFDYVIAHGLLSWVPDDVRDRVLHLSRAALTPAGVVYLSYNTMPAWGLRGAVRRALLELVGDATDERERIARARAGLAALSEIRPLAGTAEDAMLDQELAELRGRPDMYLLHEYLVSSSRAYWFRELVELAASAGLRWIADVAPTGLADDEAAQTMARLRRLAPDPIAAEQLFDVVAHRQIRASLFCRDDADVADHPHPTTERALPIPASLPERPRVHAVTRLEARELGFVTTLHHEEAALDPLHAALVEKLDGTRTHDELVDALIADVRDGRLKPAGTTTLEVLRATLPTLVARALTRLLAAPLLVE